jgi:hypothetical protein
MWSGSTLFSDLPQERLTPQRLPDHYVDGPFGNLQQKSRHARVPRGANRHQFTRCEWLPGLRDCRRFQGIEGGWTDESFAGEAPVISKRRGTTIYVPVVYNYKAVDAIVVHQCAPGRTGKPKAIVIGIQVTIAGNHMKSELNFFENWEDWASHLDAFEVFLGDPLTLKALQNVGLQGNSALRRVEARFLWIREAAKLPSIQKNLPGLTDGMARQS